MPRTARTYNVAEPATENMAAVKAALDKAGSATSIALADLPDDAAAMVRRLLEDYAGVRASFPTRLMSRRFRPPTSSTFRAPM